MLEEVVTAQVLPRKKMARPAVANWRRLEEERGTETMKVQGLIKLEGVVWSTVGSPNEELEVLNCIFDNNSLSLEYYDSGDQYRLEVSSKDGFVFEGKYEGPGEPGSVSLRYYQNKEGTAHLFYGEWSTFAEKGSFFVELFDKGRG